MKQSTNTNSDLQHTLETRKDSYGSFRANSVVAQEIIESFQTAVNKNKKIADLHPSAKASVVNATTMIASKLSRLATGDPLHIDSWHDIAGYAILMRDIAEEEIRSVDSELKTLSGFDARIYAQDGSSPFSIHGAFRDDDGWHTMRWTSEGKAFPNACRNHDLDLMIPADDKETA